MFDLSAMTMAENATRDHVRSARPRARTRPEPPPRHRDAGLRRAVVATLRRLADRLEAERVRTAAAS